MGLLNPCDYTVRMAPDVMGIFKGDFKCEHQSTVLDYTLLTGIMGLYRGPDYLAIRIPTVSRNSDVYIIQPPNPLLMCRDKRLAQMEKRMIVQQMSCLLPDISLDQTYSMQRCHRTLDQPKSRIVDIFLHRVNMSVEYRPFIGQSLLPNEIPQVWINSPFLF